MAAKAKTAKKAVKKAARKSPPAAPPRVGLSLKPAAPEEKPPRTNYCPIHGRLLRANGTCPLKKCAYHTRPVEG